MSSELYHLSKSVGNFIKYWGFKNVHGEIWTYLYLKNRPMSSAELQKEFKISKALLSTTINELLEYELIEFVKTVEHGRSTYTARDDIFEVIQSVIRQREKGLISDTLDKIKSMEKLSPHKLQQSEIDIKRLKKIKKLTQLSMRTINAITTFRDFSFKVFKSY